MVSKRPTPAQLMVTPLKIILRLEKQLASRVPACAILQKDPPEARRVHLRHISVFSWVLERTKQKTPREDRTAPLLRA